MTAEDLYALPDDGVIHELQAGRLLSEPLPGGRHGIVAARVTAALVVYVYPRRLGVVCDNDTGFILARAPDTVRGPDVAFVSRERIRQVADLRRFFPCAPDLAVEVLSPSNSPAAVHNKVAEYLAAGTRLVWVVDPEAERVTVYRTLLAPRVLGIDDELDGEDVLAGFRFGLRELFEIG